MSRLQALTRAGQAIWLDYIRRDILENGELARLIADDGVSGVTSNPAIFQQAIGESDLYDEAIAELLAEEPELPTAELFERIAVDDIRRAADLLRPVWEATGGGDGYVSLEVSPHLALDEEGSVAEARRLWRRVDRPNLMIKIPATAQGIPAVERLLAEGIHVNITLMFSLAHYEAVSATYLAGLARHPDPARLASVASFFVSRVDSKVDAELRRLGSEEASSLEGRIGIANCKMAYRRFREIFEGEPFAALAARGARPQRVLWASTSTKNPDYSDVLYVDELIGRQTVNTLPPKTVDAFRDHGTVAQTLESGLDEAERRLRLLASLGIDLDRITEELQVEGIRKFAEPYDRLLATLDGRRAELAPAASR